MDVLRVGLVGAGPWARLVHAPALAAHPATALAGVWARRHEAGERLTAEFGGRAHDRFDDLLDDVDAVSFAVSPQVQGELAVRAATAGRHLICEKPLAEALDAAQRVAAAVAAAGVVSTVVLTLRFDTGVRRWLADLPDGIAGPGTLGSARWLSGTLLGGPYAGSAWRTEHGALLDLGPHVIDLMDAALGPITVVRWAHRDEPDLWRFALGHAGGANSSMTLSMRLPIDPSEIEFAVFGEGRRHRLAARPADPRACYARLLDEFVAAVRGAGPAPELDLARALHLQEIIEQVRTTAG